MPFLYAAYCEGENKLTRLKKIRHLREIKQSELAKMLKVSQATLSNWERGVHEPDSETIVEIARIFNVTTDYLLSNSDVNEKDGHLEQAYFRVAQDAKNSGISPSDFRMALNFLKLARERDEDV